MYGFQICVECRHTYTQMCQEMTIVLLLLYALPAAFRKRGRDNEISLRELARASPLFFTNVYLNFLTREL